MNICILHAIVSGHTYVLNDCIQTMVCICGMFGKTENAFDSIKGYKELELRPGSACSYVHV